MVFRTAFALCFMALGLLLLSLYGFVVSGFMKEGKGNHLAFRTLVAVDKSKLENPQERQVWRPSRQHETNDGGLSRVRLHTSSLACFLGVSWAEDLIYLN